MEKQNSPEWRNIIWVKLMLANQAHFSYTVMARNYDFATSAFRDMLFYLFNLVSILGNLLLRLRITSAGLQRGLDKHLFYSWILSSSISTSDFFQFKSTVRYLSLTHQLSPLSSQHSFLKCLSIQSSAFCSLFLFSCYFFFFLFVRVGVLIGNGICLVLEVDKCF